MQTFTALAERQTELRIVLEQETVTTDWRQRRPQLLVPLSEAIGISAYSSKKETSYLATGTTSAITSIVKERFKEKKRNHNGEKGSWENTNDNYVDLQKHCYLLKEKKKQILNNLKCDLKQLLTSEENKFCYTKCTLTTIHRHWHV